jgi:hypothetical protein
MHAIANMPPTRALASLQVLQRAIQQHVPPPRGRPRHSAFAQHALNHWIQFTHDSEFTPCPPSTYIYIYTQQRALVARCSCAARARATPRGMSTDDSTFSNTAKLKFSSLKKNGKFYKNPVRTPKLVTKPNPTEGVCPYWNLGTIRTRFQSRKNKNKLSTVIQKL